MLAIKDVTPKKRITDSAPKMLRITSALKQPKLAPAKSAKYNLFVTEARLSKISAAHAPTKKKGITEAKKYNGNREREKGNLETAKRYVVM
jgi:hypothetical protein